MGPGPRQVCFVGLSRTMTLAHRLREEIFGGRFVTCKTVRTGERSDLFMAYDQASGDRVAIRVLRAGVTHRGRFDSEGATLESIHHAGIVRHVAHGVSEAGVPYLATEWLEGEDLAERLRHEAISPSEVVTLGIAIARALGAAHAAGVVHRDVRPATIFLPAFRTGAAKLIDFALARTDDPVRRLTHGPRLVGAAARAYVAPEQIVGDRFPGGTVGPAADLFALGCVMYEALAGEAPFHGGDPEDVLRKILFVDPTPLAARVSGLPAGLAPIVERLMAKDASDRHATADAAADALAAVPIGRRRDGIRLSVVRGRDAGMVRVIGEAVVDVGKHPSAALVLHDAAASRFHCEIGRAGGVALRLRDLGGTGTLVDGRLVEEDVVGDGVTLSIGSTLVRVEHVAGAVLGPTEVERAREGDMNVMLERRADAMTFAERLHTSGRRRRAPFAAIYGSALRMSDLVPLSGGTLLLREPEGMTGDAQRELATFAHTGFVATARGRMRVDVRLVTQPAVDLRAAVNARRFLPELFHALAGVRLHGRGAR